LTLHPARVNAWSAINATPLLAAIRPDQKSYQQRFTVPPKPQYWT
jgi:hypothetical protein